MIAVLLVSLGGPHLNGDFSTPYLAALIALVELVPRLKDRSREPSPAWQGRVAGALA
jgi:hypothetical protein